MTAAKPRPPIAPGETRAYPVLPLRNVVAFPHMIVPLFVGREKSIRALEEVMRSDTFMLLATQKNAADDDPATDAIFEVGTLASVLQLLKLPDAVASHLAVKILDKQAILETTAIAERLEKVFGLMEGELAVLQVEKRIRTRMKRQMDKTQREYFLNEQMKAIQKELGDEEGRGELGEIE